MGSLSIQEWELLSFFEVEPRLTDADVPWSYNTAVYDVTVGQHRVIFSIAPAYSDFDIAISGADSSLFEFAAKGVTDIRYAKLSDHEEIEIVVRSKHIIRFQLRPKLRLHHQLGRYA